MPTKEKLIAKGAAPESIIDRELHPAFYESSLPLAKDELGLLGDKGFYHHPHLRPNGILVAAIGNMWVENGHWRMQDMLKYMDERGWPIAYEEINDICTLPADCIGQMRTQAVYEAANAGAEWLFLVENDVLLEKDTLERLIAWDFPVVFPLCIDQERRHPGLEDHLSGPILKPDSGLYQVMWSVMSCMLFNVRVFNGTGLDIFGSHYGVNEFHLSQKLNHVGHRIFVDTDTTVGLARSPGRPRALEWDDYWGKQRATFEHSRHAERDRRPPPGVDPVFSNDVTKSGSYEPFHGSAFKWKEVGKPDVETNGNGHGGPKILSRAERRRRKRENNNGA